MPKKLKGNKTRARKNSPSKDRRKKTEDNYNEDIFNFDNEIVIGINVLPNSKEKNNKKEQVKNNKKVRRKANKEKTIKDEDKHRRNYIKAKFMIRLVMIILLFVAVYIFLITSPIFNITKINVSGNSKISEKQIISLSQISLETNTYKMSSSKVEENIKENAYVETVKVKRKLPNEVNITITERKPQYMLKYGNAYVYISNKGYILEISEEKIEKVFITGYITKEENIKEGNRLESEDLKKLELVIKVMESATNNDIAKYITEINIKDSNDIILTLESKGKTAYIGDISSINDKMIVLKQMIITAEGKSGEAILIDKDRMYFREK